MTPQQRNELQQAYRVALSQVRTLERCLGIAPHDSAIRTRHERRRDSGELTIVREIVYNTREK
ncbi:MAG: hypothetical protein M9928_21745 [Anaerolineae bacterium]|nr:hypothetical protein [Anaerolineae bacterium]MCO5195446.1 hypothetical protein [Anaerolineae bacterium]MCO5199996.1 hypothetical protein [Anaerolineae bacterium]MCO5207640.1 hypothetical protein [Anaerolineae bacterium]